VPGNSGEAHAAQREPHDKTRDRNSARVISGGGCSIPVTAAAQPTDGRMKEDVQMGDGSVLS
jgi:hypothetical protein